MASSLTPMQGFFCDVMQYGDNKLIAIENGMMIFEMEVEGYPKYFNIPLRDAVNYMVIEKMMKTFESAQKTSILWRKHPKLDEIYRFMNRTENYWK